MWNGLTREQVLALPTHRLLNVYKGIRGYTNHDFRTGDMELLRLRDDIKAELDTREHIERKK
jgi:hypothetical protein